MVVAAVRVNPFRADPPGIRHIGVPGPVLEPCLRMRVAALDLGKVRVGLAVSDELGVIAHPRPPLAGGNQKKLLSELRLLARDEKIRRFLVGLPLNRQGEEGREAQRVRKFAQALADATGREIELVDERLSTVEATRRLREGGVSAKKGRQRVDGASAAVLLQAWLDHSPLGARRREPSR